MGGVIFCENWFVIRDTSGVYYSWQLEELLMHTFHLSVCLSFSVLLPVPFSLFFPFPLFCCCFMFLQLDYYVAVPGSKANLVRFDSLASGDALSNGGDEELSSPKLLTPTFKAVSYTHLTLPTMPDV